MLDYDNFVALMMKSIKTINEEAAKEENKTLLKYVCQETADRISIFLNLKQYDEFDERIVRIGTKIASGLFTQTKANISGGNDDTSVKSLSDNGQSITYGDTTRNYLATVTDGELFGGFAELLKPYRRINVVSRKC